MYLCTISCCNWLADLKICFCFHEWNKISQALSCSWVFNFQSNLMVSETWALRKLWYQKFSILFAIAQGKISEVDIGMVKELLWSLLMACYTSNSCKWWAVLLDHFLKQKACQFEGFESVSIFSLDTFSAAIQTRICPTTQGILRVIVTFIK